MATPIFAVVLTKQQFKSQFPEAKKTTSKSENGRYALMNPDEEGVPTPMGYFAEHWDSDLPTMFGRQDEIEGKPLDKPRWIGYNPGLEDF